MKSLLLSLLSLGLFGCTVAPLTEQHTARTLGRDSQEWSFAAGSPGYLSIGFARGLTERLDVSGVAEIQGIGFLTAFQLKYSLNSNPSETPVSIFAGAGIGSSTSFVYAGPVLSFRTGKSHEIAFSARYNVFKWSIEGSDNRDDAGEYASDLFDDLSTGVNDDYHYVSLDVSNTLWFSNSNGLTLSVTGLAGVKEISGESLKYGLKFHTKY